MTNEKIMQIALQQSAYDCNCKPEDFLKKDNVVTRSRANEKSRCYIPLPAACDLVTYGNNIVAQTSKETEETVRAYINKYPAERCFETPNMHILNDALIKFDLKICFMAEYFLPDVTKLKPLPCEFETRILHQKDFKELYLPEWSNALCSDRKEKDIIGVGAYDDGKLIALAGASADCEMMYQIGIDVLPGYRRKGIAAALTSQLSLAIIELGKVPFYCAAWSNIKSVRNAIKSGFRPAWVELTARDSAFVDKMNG